MDINTNMENKEKPQKPKPDKKPQPEIQAPSTSPLREPASTPGIDRTPIMPERDSTDMPIEMPGSDPSPEIGLTPTPNVDENRPH